MGKKNRAYSIVTVYGDKKPAWCQPSEGSQCPLLSEKARSTFLSSDNTANVEKAHVYLGSLCHWIPHYFTWWRNTGPVFCARASEVFQDDQLASWRCEPNHFRNSAHEVLLIAWSKLCLRLWDPSKNWTEFRSMLTQKKNLKSPGFKAEEDFCTGFQAAWKSCGNLTA